jgi:hypothetical protein
MLVNIALVIGVVLAAGLLEGVLPGTLEIPEAALRILVLEGGSFAGSALNSLPGVCCHRGTSLRLIVGGNGVPTFLFVMRHGCLHAKLV